MLAVPSSKQWWFFSPKIYSKFFLNQGTGKQFKNAQLYTLSHGILKKIVKTNL